MRILTNQILRSTNVTELPQLFVRKYYGTEILQNCIGTRLAGLVRTKTLQPQILLSNPGAGSPREAPVDETYNRVQHSSPALGLAKTGQEWSE